MSNSMEHLYSNDTSSYDERDENYQSSEEEHEYYCEVCDREFLSEECLARHKGEHQVCGIDGCIFTAHPKLVEKHISMQHSTGLYNRMKNLSTPEDIANWIMERKKRYPTKANIECQAAEALEKKKRYEVIREKKTLAELKTIKHESKKLAKRKTRRKPVGLPISAKMCETQLYKGLEAFAGTLSLHEPPSYVKHSFIEDSDNETELQNTKDASDPDKMSVIRDYDENHTFSLSLVADYGTDSDIDNGPEEIPFKKMKLDTDDPLITRAMSNPDEYQNNNKSRSRNNNRRNKSAEFGKLDQTDNEYTNERQGQRFKKMSNENHSLKDKAYKTNKNRLLNKLLSRSIQHERNLISQCVKYIVDSNYFE